MKSRISYFFIFIILILSIFAGAFIWRNKHLKEIPKFNAKSFTAPISSEYVPTNAKLAFHWKINPKMLPNYIENYQDKVNKNSTNKKTELIRDSLFKLISLDFRKDISKWAGEHGSFAMFETNEKLLNDWLLVLEINKDVNIEEELKSITETSFSDQNNELNISTTKIISKKINQNKEIYFLNEKEHMLISSNPKIIESSIDKLGYNRLSIKEKYKNIQLKDNLNDGFLLFEFSPKKVFNLIGQEENLLEINQTDKLISSINIDNKRLILEGILSYNIKNKTQINDPNYNLFKIEKEFELFDNLILIDNPQEYFGNNSIHPYQKLIASVIEQSTKADYSNLFKIILQNTKRNLIWLKDKNWLAITMKADSGNKKINEILKKEKFINSKLEFKNKNLEIWSKITTNNNEKYELKENIEAIVEGNEDLYIWSKDLSSISNFDTKKYLQNNVNNQYIVNENNDFNDVIRIHLGNKNTKVFLNNFYPYILLRTLVGNKLDFPQNIDMSVAIPTINYPDFVKFKIDLKTS